MPPTQQTTAAATTPEEGSPLQTLRQPLLRNNPVMAQILGVCSALAVTGLMSTTLTMCGALLFVATGSTFIVACIRRWIPHRVRLIAQMLIISTLVILVDLYLKAEQFRMSRMLGPYVGLIITNCIILGRCEAFASRHGPIRSALDGAGNALGYALTLTIVALVREPLGRGTLLGWHVLPDSYEPCQLLAAAPGAFLAMGLLVWIVRSIWPEAGQHCADH
ncbi:MAG: Rnf-Nqr domain containing protein [Planctomycetota bacterium]